jgi:branched-chain amino acid transport system ATP-binding protein
LSGISIEVPEGETVLLVGANGAGKSSTINAIIGLVPVAKGSISFDGKEIGTIPCDRRARLGIGYSPEGRVYSPRCR